jgi:hypothetical protein
VGDMRRSVLDRTKKLTIGIGWNVKVQEKLLE